MKKTLFIYMCLILGLSQLYAADDKVTIPKDDKWEETNERSNNAPQLYQNDSSVYVYSEKELNNLTIGITDMMGNVYHYEVTTVPACMYYAVSIESLPAGQYYLSVYQGSNYVIGLFNISD